MKVVGAPQGTSQSQSDSCGMPRQRVIGLKVVISVHEEAATGCERKLPQSMQALPVSLPVLLLQVLFLCLCLCTPHYVHVPCTIFMYLKQGSHISHLLSVSKRTPPTHSALGLHPHQCTSAVFMQPLYARCASCQCPCCSGMHPIQVPTCACVNPILQARMHTHAAESPPVREHQPSTVPGKLPRSVQPTRSDLLMLAHRGPLGSLGFATDPRDQTLWRGSHPQQKLKGRPSPKPHTPQQKAKSKNHST
jgi:hypothetical protein